MVAANGNCDTPEAKLFPFPGFVYGLILCESERRGSTAQRATEMHPHLLASHPGGFFSVTFSYSLCCY